MFCLFCSQEGSAGGTHLGIQQSVAVCTRCGAGICRTHLRRAENGELACTECAERGPATPPDRHAR